MSNPSLSAEEEPNSVAEDRRRRSTRRCRDGDRESLPQNERPQYDKPKKPEFYTPRDDDRCRQLLAEKRAWLENSDPGSNSNASSRTEVTHPEESAGDEDEESPPQDDRPSGDESTERPAPYQSEDEPSDRSNSRSRDRNRRCREETTPQKPSRPTKPQFYTPRDDDRCRKILAEKRAWLEHSRSNPSSNASSRTEVTDPEESTRDKLAQGESPPSYAQDPDSLSKASQSEDEPSDRLRSSARSRDGNRRCRESREQKDPRPTKPRFYTPRDDDRCREALAENRAWHENSRSNPNLRSEVTKPSPPSSAEKSFTSKASQSEDEGDSDRSTSRSNSRSRRCSESKQKAPRPTKPQFYTPRDDDRCREALAENRAWMSNSNPSSRTEVTKETPREERVENPKSRSTRERCLEEVRPRPTPQKPQFYTPTPNRCSEELAENRAKVSNSNPPKDSKAKVPPVEDKLVKEKQTPPPKPPSKAESSKERSSKDTPPPKEPPKEPPKYPKEPPKDNKGTGTPSKSGSDRGTSPKEEFDQGTSPKEKVPQDEKARKKQTRRERCLERLEKERQSGRNGKNGSGKNGKNGKGGKNKKCKDRCCCKCLRNCCKCFCSRRKPSLFKTWYCCSCWLIPILMVAVTLLTLELVFSFLDGIGLTGGGKGKNNPTWIWIIVIFVLAIITSIFLIGLTQITFFWIRNEYKSCKSIICWLIIFVIAVLCGLAAIASTIFCWDHCVIGDQIIADGFPWVDKMRIISIFKLALIIIVFHIYVYHTYYNYQQEKEMNDPDPRCVEARRKALEKGRKKDAKETGNTKTGKKVAPADCLDGYETDTKFKVFRIKI